MTHEIKKLTEAYDEAVKATKEAWGKLAAAIVLSAPVKVGDIIATPGGESNTEGTYKIAAVQAVDWHDRPRYRVIKAKKDGGWYSGDMNVPGLSADINDGRYKLVEEAS